MADAASDAGLIWNRCRRLQAKLKELIHFAGTRNPVDFTAMVYNDLSLITKNFDVILVKELRRGCRFSSRSSLIRSSRIYHRSAKTDPREIPRGPDHHVGDWTKTCAR